MNTEFSPGRWRGPKPDISLCFRNWKSILSLQCATLETMQVSEEREWCAKQNVPFFHVPMSMITPPTGTEIDAALSIINNQSNWPILVHCHDGVDRTGIVVAHHRMEIGNKTFGEAIGEMLDMGFHLQRYFWWLPCYRAEEVR